MRRNICLSEYEKILIKGLVIKPKLQCVWLLNPASIPELQSTSSQLVGLFKLSLLACVLLTDLNQMVNVYCPVYIFVNVFILKTHIVFPMQHLGPYINQSCLVRYRLNGLLGILMDL